MKMVIQVLLSRLYEMTDVVSVVLIGVIGGSGLYHLDNLTFVYVSEHCPEWSPRDY